MNKAFKMMHRFLTKSYLFLTIFSKSVLLKDFRITINDIRKVEWVPPPLECWEHTDSKLSSKISPCVWFHHFRSSSKCNYCQLKIFPKTQRKPFILSDPCECRELGILTKPNVKSLVTCFTLKMTRPHLPAIQGSAPTSLEGAFDSLQGNRIHLLSPATRQGWGGRG